jgi:hypothetical protein
VQSLVVTAGQRGDSPQFQAVLDGINVPRIGAGRPRVSGGIGVLRPARLPELAPPRAPPAPPCLTATRPTNRKDGP